MPTTNPASRFPRAPLAAAAILLLTFAVGAAGPDRATLRLLSIAEAQHEIVQLYLQQGNPEAALREYQVILDLGLPAAYEEAVFKEIVIVTLKLHEAERPDLAYQALDAGVEVIATPEFQARLLNVRATLLKRDGRLEEAIAAYKEEVALREHTLRARPEDR